MIYEAKAAIQTLRKEGLGSLAAKIRLYGQQLLWAADFLRRPRPENLNAPDLVDYSLHVAHGLIQPSQVKSEIVGLLDLMAEKKPRTIVEIGTANGGTLFLFCALADPQGQVISIDLPNGVHGGGYPFWKTFLYRRFVRPTQKLHLIRASSRDPITLQCLQSMLGGKTIDFLFIDGDHTYEGVKADFQNYSPMVSRGGLVVFHDICRHAPEANCQADLFWQEIKSHHHHVEFIENPAQGWGGIGVLFW